MGVERSFVIADLVGFTAAVDAHGDEVAVELAETLVRAADRALGPGDAVVKGMGDAVLVVSEGPRDAVGFVRRLFDEFADEADQLPVLRAGAHHGSAIARGGDYFGAGVNVAARVADLSAGCQVLATGAIAEAARGLGVGVVDLGWYDLRNVSDPVQVFEIDCGQPTPGKGIAVCPRCSSVEFERAFESAEANRQQPTLIGKSQQKRVCQNDISHERRSQTGRVHE